ncbi:hypothetical protein [Limnobacter parvus]|uniref:Dicarboxylate transport domain-containing protein n=1 Tax=Limnobacter parvus TaxID=2939690 RepID=A0ABT1XIP3_9BURK|nr:hypothetical protein [Limnobacter parvus]MCR2747147.1 hypothetical protein [Limnobacter parvus]
MKNRFSLLATLAMPLVFFLLPAALAVADATTNNAASSALETVQDWRSSLPRAASTGEHALVQVRNSQLSLADNIEFKVDQLHGLLRPTGAGQSVSLDIFSAFEVEVSYARLQIADAVLQTLVQAELQASDAPLRITRVETTPEAIRIAGDIRRLGLWIPFTMEGKPTVKNHRQITLTPSTLKVAGLPVYQALLATNIQLQSLINMKSKAVALQGQAMVLNLDQVLQAPRIDFELNALQLGDGEVSVQFGSTEQAPPFFCSTSCPGSFVYTEGGTLRAAGMVLSGQPALVTGVSNGFLPIALNNLNRLITTSTVQLRTDGAIWISAQEGTLSESETALLSKGEQAIAELDGFLNAQTKPQTVTLAVREATLLSKEGIELRVENLLASTNATDLGQLPTAPQNVHAGQILLSENALNIMMNKALFNYSGSPIRKVKSTIGEPHIELALQVKPQILGIPLLWLPATLRGELLVSSDQLHLEFTPTQVHMFGMSMLPIIEYVGLELESLIKIDEAAVKLRGNTIHIALNSALPPLQLNSKLQTVKPIQRSPFGPVIQVQVGLHASKESDDIYNTLATLPSGLWINTPEFTALGMRTGPTLGHVYSAPRSERLVIDLAQYPELLSSATLRLPKAQRVWVSMPGALDGS